MTKEQTPHDNTPEPLEHEERTDRYQEQTEADEAELRADPPEVLAAVASLDTSELTAGAVALLAPPPRDKVYVPMPGYYGEVPREAPMPAEFYARNQKPSDIKVELGGHNFDEATLNGVPLPGRFVRDPLMHQARCGICDQLVPADAAGRCVEHGAGDREICAGSSLPALHRTWAQPMPTSLQEAIKRLPARLEDASVLVRLLERLKLAGEHVRLQVYLDGDESYIGLRVIGKTMHETSQTGDLQAIVLQLLIALGTVIPKRSDAPETP